VELLNTGLTIDPWGIPPVAGFQLSFHVADHNSSSLEVCSLLLLI